MIVFRVGQKSDTACRLHLKHLRKKDPTLFEAIYMVPYALVGHFKSKGYPKVERYTKGVDIFKKKYVIFQILINACVPHCRILILTDFFQKPLGAYRCVQPWLSLAGPECSCASVCARFNGLRSLTSLQAIHSVFRLCRESAREVRGRHRQKILYGYGGAPPGAGPHGIQVLPGSRTFILTLSMLDMTSPGFAAAQ